METPTPADPPPRGGARTDGLFGHEGAAALLITVITTAVCGWITVDVWRGEYVTPVIYLFAGGLTVILAVQVKSWWHSRQRS